MNLRQAVLREHIGIYVDDPAEPCIALRCPKDDPKMSLYHQLVLKPGDTNHFIQQVHMIASPSRVKEASSYFKRVYRQKLEPVGETYCVSPYTLGFARLGKDDAKNMKAIARFLSRPTHFPDYVRNWLDTTDGQRALMEDLKEEECEENGFVSWQKYLVEPDGKQADDLLDKAKEYYAEYYAANNTWTGHKDFVKKRMAEFQNAAKELTDENIAILSQRYYAKSHAQETEHRESQVRDYIKTKPLLKDLIVWT